ALEMPVNEEVGRLDTPAVLEWRLTGPTTEPEVGGALGEHVVRREDQRAWFAGGNAELAAPVEPTDQRDACQQHHGRECQPHEDHPERDGAGPGPLIGR